MRDHGADRPGVRDHRRRRARTPRSRTTGPAPTELRRGDLVTMDFGALVDGYHSDMTRTVVLGPAADWQRELYALVAAAQAGRPRGAGARHRASPTWTPRRARWWTRAGRAEQFVHALGHGVGLQIHEAPLLAATSDGHAGRRAWCVTVEPGVYLPGRGGVRIEDTLLVRDGAPLLLTHQPAELLEVG